MSRIRWSTTGSSRPAPSPRSPPRSSRSPPAVEAITIPTLIAYGTADGLCPPAGSLMLNHRIGAEDKTLKAYEGLYHELLNEPEQESVLDDMCGWLSAHLLLAAR